MKIQTSILRRQKEYLLHHNNYKKLSITQLKNFVRKQKQYKEEYRIISQDYILLPQLVVID